MHAMMVNIEDSIITICYIFYEFGSIYSINNFEINKYYKMSDYSSTSESEYEGSSSNTSDDSDVDQEEIGGKFVDVAKYALQRGTQIVGGKSKSIVDVVEEIMEESNLILYAFTEQKNYDFKSLERKVSSWKAVLRASLIPSALGDYEDPEMGKIHGLALIICTSFFEYARKLTEKVRTLGSNDWDKVRKDYYPEFSMNVKRLELY